VSKLVVRFPERNEYEVSSSDFGAVKARLVAINTSRRSESVQNERERPTLKRRPAPATDSSNSTKVKEQ
jgi:hypothetical protein